MQAKKLEKVDTKLPPFTDLHKSLEHPVVIEVSSLSRGHTYMYTRVSTRASKQVRSTANGGGPAGGGQDVPGKFLKLGCKILHSGLGRVKKWSRQSRTGC